jgi:hypothetical protein
LANSCPPHARSRYLPPNQTTADEMTRETILFSMSALVRNVQGNLIDLVGIKTRYGMAHCGEVRYIEGAVVDCSFVGVAVDQERKRRAAFTADSERRVSRRPRVSGGRLIRGGISKCALRRSLFGFIVQYSLCEVGDMSLRVETWNEPRQGCHATAPRRARRSLALAYALQDDGLHCTWFHGSVHDMCTTLQYTACTGSPLLVVTKQ